jgi:hypothetical protein
MYILSPPTGFHTQAQIKTHMAIIPMLCLFLMGLQDEDKRAIWFSLAVIALILFGFFVFPGDINVWLAFVLSLPLFLIGLHPYLKWR